MHEACIQEGRICGLEHDMDNMNGWQKSQNGAIHRVEEKIDKLTFWGMTFAVSTLVSIILLLIKK